MSRVVKSIVVSVGAFDPNTKVFVIDCGNTIAYEKTGNTPEEHIALIEKFAKEYDVDTVSLLGSRIYIDGLVKKYNELTELELTYRY